MYSIKRSGTLVLHSNHHTKPITYDITWPVNQHKNPVILHIHGFKGFKDWGFFNQMAETFASHGFIFIKMNFSHNGVSIDHPTEFVDLEAFGNNNFTIEQSDMGIIINHIYAGELPLNDGLIDRESIYLTGHSRGGTAVILKGYHDDRIKAVASWAAVNDLSNYFTSKELELWKKRGVTYVENSRTGQKMPLYYQLAEDYKKNEQYLSVPKTIKEFTKPMLVAHGSKDPTVPVESAYQIKEWNPAAELFIVDGADHVFGGAHPWEKDELPDDMVKVVDKTIDFFKSS